MTGHPSASAAATTADGAPSSEGFYGQSLVRLNAMDGLFLRAEHLQAIQDYARDLATAIGRASGSGVVHGYTAALSGTRLQVGAGLAVASSGQPLPLDSPASVPLPSPGSGAGTGTRPGFWVVEVIPATTPAGDPEQVYGLLCDDACGSGQQFRPYLADGIQIRFRPDSTALPAWAGGQFRSAVAAAYFERERTSAPSLLPTSERDGHRSDLGSVIWSTGTDLPGTEGVPIGLLLRDGADWVLDVWAARRDRFAAPPERGWERRSGRRPRDIFLAQVLQFQAQQAELGIPGQVRSGVGGAPTLPEYFVELPPAGYLPVDPSSTQSVNDQVTRLFGPNVDLRFCSARPDEIGLALERAQHLDRVRLSDTPHPKVDVIVPNGEPATRPATSSVRFAQGEIKLTPAPLAKSAPHAYSGLARLSYAPGAELTLAFAGAGDSVVKGEQDGLWSALRLCRSPFELKQGDNTLVQATLAAHQPGRRAQVGQGVLQRFVLFGQLYCLGLSTDAATGLPTFEGQFRGQLMVRLGSRQRELPVTANLRLALQLVPGPGYVLRAELASPLAETLEVHLKNQVGGWEITFDTSTASFTRRLGTVVSAEFGELPASGVPFSPFRWYAEQGLATLDPPGFQQDAVTLLFAGAGPPAIETAYTTGHDWVFFTRRHLLDCGPLVAKDPQAIRLDLYTHDIPRRQVGMPAAVAPAAPAPAAAPAAPAAAAAVPAFTTSGLRYVAQLEWARETGLLSADSEQIVDAWRQFHPGSQATGALIWAGHPVTQDQGQALAGQVIQRMNPLPNVPVEVPVVPPAAPTTAGSAGVLIVGVDPG